MCNSWNGGYLEVNVYNTLKKRFCSCEYWEWGVGGGWYLMVCVLVNTESEEVEGDDIVKLIILMVCVLY